MFCSVNLNIITYIYIISVILFWAKFQHSTHPKGVYSISLGYCFESLSKISVSWVYCWKGRPRFFCTNAPDIDFWSWQAAECLSQDRENIWKIFALTWDSTVFFFRSELGHKILLIENPKRPHIPNFSFQTCLLGNKIPKTPSIICIGDNFLMKLKVLPYKW